LSALRRAPSVQKMSRKSKAVPTRTLTIYLLKKDCVDPASSIRALAGWRQHSLVIEGDQVGTLYVDQPRSNPAGWLSFVRQYATPALSSDLVNASTRAVLLVPCDARFFAVTFGYGRHMLVPGSYEERFGLMVTLNSIPRDKLRSIDAQSFDAISSHRRTQASREGTADDFGFDVEQDLLRAATGTPTDASLGARLDGMDALHTTVAVELRDLRNQLRRYLVKFSDDAYKTNFPWLDHISEVRSGSVVARLNQAIIARLAGPAPGERLWLAAPEIIDWKNIRGFRYDKEAKTVDPHPDLHVDDFLKTCVDPTQLTIDVLKSRRIASIASSNDKEHDAWPVYKCIYAEIEEGDKTFVLSAGKWYAVHNDLVRDVSESVSQLASTAIALPDYDDASESEYNQRVAASSQAYALMDGVGMQQGGRHTAIELCDLLRSDKTLIHVKRYAGSSKPLSHLFSQGEVSAVFFLSDEIFRGRVREKLPASHIDIVPVAQPRASDYEVVFAIVSRSTKPVASILPFFSRLNLRNRARTLRAMGLRVSLAKIKSTQ